MTTEITTAKPEPTPLALYAIALEKGIDPEHLHRLLDLQERIDKRRAEEDFAHALATFQAKCGRVMKSRKTKEAASGFGYQFASFDDVMAVAGPVLAEQGISVAFDTDHNLEKGILTVTCRIRVGSHTEDRKFACPVASSLKVSDAQKYGSALSYAKRYCLCAALNIVTTDHDDDGRAGTSEFLTTDQIATVNDLLDDAELDDTRWTKFKAWAGIPEGGNVGDILACRFDDVTRNLKRMINEKGTAK